MTSIGSVMTFFSISLSVIYCLTERRKYRISESEQERLMRLELKRNCERLRKQRIERDCERLRKQRIDRDRLRKQRELERKQRESQGKSIARLGQIMSERDLNDDESKGIEVEVKVKVKVKVKTETKVKTKVNNDEMTESSTIGDDYDVIEMTKSISEHR